MSPGSSRSSAAVKSRKSAEGAHAAGSREVVESSLRNGIILVFVGLGLLAAFAMLRYVVGTAARGL
ncbi:MAG: hypothetical protein ABIP38_09615 [Steroidobacteraceae bacterium]